MQCKRKRIKFREISGAENIATQFRDFAGPADPELGKQIRPNSLRSRFGIDKVKNALHVTDLPEDGVLEVNLKKLKLDPVFFQDSCQLSTYAHLSFKNNKITCNKYDSATILALALTDNFISEISLSTSSMN